MRIVIIDDERLARAELAGLLAQIEGAQVVGEASDAREGVRVIGKTGADLVFLDISMPEQSGFDLLAMLPLPHPKIIFVTAHDTYALRAFEVNALDYLMKPVVPKRLAEAYRRAAENAGEGADETSPVKAIPLREDDQVLLRDEGRCWFVPVRTLRLLEGEDNHTHVWFENEKVMLYRTLASMEERLPNPLFFRANRSQLVNRLFIVKVEPWFSGSVKVTLTDGKEIEFSRRQAQQFRERTML